jgi:hypothetical protein
MEIDKMEKIVQVEVVGGLIALAAIALFVGQGELAQIVMAGLVGFLGGQAIVPADKELAAA